MRGEKVLISVLKKFVEVVAEEYDKNIEFAQKVDMVLEPLTPKSSKKPKQNEPQVEPIPDLNQHFHSRDEVDFTLWLMEQPVPVLLATIRSYELDARKQSAKWKDAKKLADLIVDKLRSKASRGSAFIKTTDSEQSEIKEDGKNDNQ